MTGMRQGEILGLRWSDIDFEKSVLHVRRSMKKDKEVTSKLKTAGSKRTIALSPLTIDVLLEHRQFLEDEREERIAAGKDYFDTEHVVCNSQGKPTRASKILDAWYRLCNKYKPEHEPDITFHDLRHQSASIMLNEREDVRVVSKRLGHSTIHTTMKVYSHLLPNAQESAALSLDKAVGFNNDDKDQSTTYLQ
jgi:integrase